MGRAQRNANHGHRASSVDSNEKPSLLDVKGAELTKDPRTSQKSKFTSSPTIIRTSMAKVVTTTSAALPRVIVSHHTHIQ